MSDPKQKLDPALQEVADKILHDLPEEVAMGISFKLHEGGDALVLTYPKSLHGTPDMHLLDNTVRRYSGAFVSRGKDKSFYLIPKPKSQQPVTEQSKEDPKPEATPAAPIEAPKPVDVKTAEPTPAPTPEKQKLPTELANEATEKRNKETTEKTLKQSSPIATFKAKVCISCSDADSCSAEHMRLCFSVLKMESMADISRFLDKLATDLPLALGDLSAQLSMFSVAVPQPKPPTAPSQLPKVQRETNPREGFEEDGLVWVKVFENGTANLKYLKAYEKDNQGRQRFADLAKWITDKKDKPFTKLHFLGEECQVFLWNFNQGPSAIGKSKCKSQGSA